MIRLLALEAFAYVLAYVLDWLQGPVTDTACRLEDWCALKGWFIG